MAVLSPLGLIDRIYNAVKKSRLMHAIACAHFDYRADCFIAKLALQGFGKHITPYQVSYFRRD